MINKTLLTLFVCLTVILSGCASLGNTDTTDDSDDQSPDNSDDLEDEHDNTNSDSDSDSSSDSDSNSSTDINSSSSESTGSNSGTDSDAGDSTDESDASHVSDDSDSSDDTTDSTNKTDSDSNSTSNSDSSSDTSTQSDSSSDSDSDSDSESDSNDGTDTDGNEDDNADRDDSDDDQNNEIKENNDNDNDNETDNDNDNDTDTDNDNDNGEETHSLVVETNTDEAVTIEQEETGETWSEEATDGTATFDLPEGLYYISADNHLSTLAPIAVPDTDTIHLQSETTDFTVTVVDAETGDGIDSAEISGMCDLWYSNGDATITGTANEDGVIHATTLTPTTCRYDLSVTADGYESATLDTFSVPDADGMTVELQPEENEDEEYPALTMDSDSGQLVISNPTNETVSLEGWSVTANDGEKPGYDLGQHGELAPGETVRVDYTDSAHDLWNPAGEIVASANYHEEGGGDGDDETHTLRVQTTSHVPVTVENEETGETWSEEATDNEAVFDLPAGLYDVTADDHYSTLHPIDVPDFEEIQLQGWYEDFTINVVDAETGEGIEGAEISGVCDMWYSSGDEYIVGTSDADGVIETGVIYPSGCSGINVEADGYESITFGDISIPEDDGITIELESNGANESDEQSRVAPSSLFASASV